MDPCVWQELTLCPAQDWAIRNWSPANAFAYRNGLAFAIDKTRKTLIFPKLNSHSASHEAMFRLMNIH